ncbi:MAG: DUF2442 domain-containing protein [Alkalinema sp. CAN_BIN05]|nr:DUF2442 domain-containing protein [Alkalinema sp. CAN_BIN05]
MTEQDFNEMFNRAEMNAQIVDLTEPRAVSAHYEIETGKIVIHLRDGAVFMFPHHLGQGLAQASAEDLGTIEVTPSGYGLHWEALDVDLSVPSLLKGVYGTRIWMEQLHAVIR